LGSIVNGLLVTNLRQQLASIPGLPKALWTEVITSVTTGSANTSASNLPKTGPIARIVNQVLAAADSSFTDALNVVLILAAAMLLLSAVVSLGLVRGRHRVEAGEG
jgi:hypothetical protein